MSRPTTTVALLIAVLALAGCNKPAGEAKAPADTTKSAEAVKAEAAQLVQDFNAHDAAKAVSHDAPGSVGMFHGTPNTVGVDQDLAATKALLADPAVKFEISNESVDVANSDDMTVLRATYTYTYTDPKTKKPTTETGNIVQGYKKQPDGSWKIAWSVGSDTPASAPTAAAPAGSPPTKTD